MNGTTTYVSPQMPPAPDPGNFYSADLCTTLLSAFPQGLMPPGMETEMQYKVRRRLRDVGWRVIFPPGEAWQTVVEHFAIAGIEKMQRGFGHDPWFWVVAWPSVFGAAAADFWPEHGTPQERRHLAAEACAAHLEAMLLSRTIRDAGTGGLLPPPAAKALRVLGQSTLPSLPEFKVRDSAMAMPHRPPLHGSPSNAWSSYRPPRSVPQPPPFSAERPQTTCDVEPPTTTRAPSHASPVHVSPAQVSPAQVSPAQVFPAQVSPEAPPDLTVQRGTQLQLEAQPCKCGVGRLVPALRSFDVYGKGLIALCNLCEKPCGLDTPSAAQAPFLHCSECKWDLCANCATSSRKT